LLAVAAFLLLSGAHADAAGRAAPVVNPNTLPKGTGDADTVVILLSPGLYQLDVENTSGIGYIDSFNWVPPPAMTITSIRSSEGGKCVLVSGAIHCTGKIAPPTCLCTPGGSLIVNFTATGLDPTFANGYWTYYGLVGAYLQIETVTPVPYHIPSYVPNPYPDLPFCKKGQKTTTAKPCLPPPA
jgi:hypothetical protein